MVRKVPPDPLVSIAAARYSVPVRYVGATVMVHETATHYEIFHDNTLIARHQRAERHSVDGQIVHRYLSEPQVRWMSRLADACLCLRTRAVQ